MPAHGETLELTFDNRLADHLAAERLYYKSTIHWKIDRVVAVLLFALGGWLTRGAGLHWWTLMWFPLALAEWFNLLSIRPLQIVFWFRRNPKFLETYHLTFGSEGIRFRTATIDSLIQWAFYTRMLEDRRLCLLVYGSHMYTVVPKRAFESEAGASAFRALVAANVGRSASGSPPGSS